MILLPALRNKEYGMRQAVPRPPSPRRVQPAADESGTALGQVLQQLRDEVGGDEELGVGAQVVVVGGVVQHAA